MSVLVYQAIHAIAADLSHDGIAKAHTNSDDAYQYRSVDDVMAALAPLFARHKLCVLPKVLERSEQRASGATQVTVRSAFEIVSALDGSRHRVETFGEAIDGSDKATAKAISAAYKSAMLQTFCIPVPQEDADARSPRKAATLSLPEPVEGWEVWAHETIAVITSCQSAEAIDRLCETRRHGLVALQRSRPLLYGEIGEAISQRLLELQPRADADSAKLPRAPANRRTRQSNAARQTSKAA